LSGLDFISSISVADGGPRQALQACSDRQYTGEQSHPSHRLELPFLLDCADLAGL
jgi:hypothetical protein